MVMAFARRVLGYPGRAYDLGRRFVGYDRRLDSNKMVNATGAMGSRIGAVLSDERPSNGKAHDHNAMHTSNKGDQ